MWSKFHSKVLVKKDENGDHDITKVPYPCENWKYDYDSLKQGEIELSLHRLAAFLNVRQFGERIFSDLKETYWMIGLALIGTEFISFADNNVYPRCMSSVIHMDCSDEISCWIHGLGLNFGCFPWNRELAWLLCIQAVLCLDIIGSRDTQEYLSGALIFWFFFRN